MSKSKRIASSALTVRDAFRFLKHTKQKALKSADFKAFGADSQISLKGLGAIKEGLRPFMRRRELAQRIALTRFRCDA